MDNIYNLTTKEDVVWCIPQMMSLCFHVWQDERKEKRRQLTINC